MYSHTATTVRRGRVNRRNSRLLYTAFFGFECIYQWRRSRDSLSGGEFFQRTLADWIPSDGQAVFSYNSILHQTASTVWFKLLIFLVTAIVTVNKNISVTVMKTFELQLIFSNNCNRYLIQLLLRSKYLVTDQNLAVHFCEHFIVNWNVIFPRAQFRSTYRHK